MIIDMDSHLRDGYFLDEIYQLEGPLAKFTPQKADDGPLHATRFIHSLDPGDPRAAAAFKHPYIYDPKNDPELAERQRGGYEVRLSSGRTAPCCGRQKHFALKPVHFSVLKHHFYRGKSHSKKLPPLFV